MLQQAPSIPVRDQASVSVYWDWTGNSWKSHSPGAANQQEPHSLLLAKDSFLTLLLESL